MQQKTETIEAEHSGEANDIDIQLREMKNELLIVEILDLVDELQLHQNKLAKDMQKGFVGFAQAKYVLGPSVLTRSNYDKRMKANYLLAQGDSTTLINNPDEPRDPLKWYEISNEFPPHC
ncbi:hypothetical protein HDV01_000121 [Terramyces sp. JEL0728]|nr:hypothetical protein HDV01_000121 [Terramyces sp. JEL0728]